MQREYDYSKLNGRIIEKFGSRKEFAKALSLSKTSLYAKLNNKVDFTRKEIEQCKDLLELDEANIYTYFFTCKVDEISTDKKAKKKS